MVQRSSRSRPTEPVQAGYDGFEDRFTNANSEQGFYEFGRTAQDAYLREANMPLFLSDPDGEPEPEEFVDPLRRRGIASVSSKILLAVVAASGIAMLLAWFSSDATRDMIVDAKASISAALPTPSATAQADAAQLWPADLQVREPARAPQAQPAPVQPEAAAVSRAPAQSSSTPSSSAAAIVVANAPPSREDIATAYQNALQDQPETTASPGSLAAAPAEAVSPRQDPKGASPFPAPLPMASAPIATERVHHLAPDQIASLLRRGDDLLKSGDVAAARLVLRRAAEAGDVRAMIKLGATYDPALLSHIDNHGMAPDLASARGWYEKAAQLGSPEARRRLDALAQLN